MSRVLMCSEQFTFVACFRRDSNGFRCGVDFPLRVHLQQAAERQPV